MPTDAVRAHRALALASLVVALAVLSAGCLTGVTRSSPGSQARDMVSAEKYSKLVVEVDWMVENGLSYEPSNYVLQGLENRLNERVSKPGGIEVRLGNAIAADRARYRADDLFEVERTHRQAKTSADTVSIWILFATRSADDSGNSKVIGVAYSGSSCAVFAATIRDEAGLLVSADSVARIVLIHEAGHLMGLVNLGAPMMNPHEDTAHPKHSLNPDSVMYWQAESADLIGLLRGGRAPDNFDADDIADLRAIGGE